MGLSKLFGTVLPHKAYKKLSISTVFINLAFVTIIFLVLNTLINTGILNRYYSTIIVLVLVAIVMSASLNIATGFLGQLVLGHAGFMAIGAYTAALIGIALYPVITDGFLFLSRNLLIFLISASGAALTASIAGLLVGTPALRLRGDYLGIMTLGFGEIVRIILTNVEFTGGAQGLKAIPRIMTFPIAFWTTATIVLVIYLFMFSRHGRAILSIREDEIASESVGINITKYKIMGFVLASMFGGIGGAIFAFQGGFLAPVSFGFIKSVEIFVIVVLGGMGSISGAIVAAIFLTFLPELLRDFDQYRLLLYSMMLILTMLFRPQGMMGTKEFDTPRYLRALKRFFLRKKKTDDLLKGSDQ
ncbi:MAG: branched-chain amino acid ABC transporter permease [Bacilli bacterium]|nr:branched-chain amino acid ABC transporter permease [Bacilli bacterium]